MIPQRLEDFTGDMHGTQARASGRSRDVSTKHLLVPVLDFLARLPAELSPTEVLVELVLTAMLQLDGAAFPAQETLAQLAHCSRDTVKRAVHALETRGRLEVDRARYDEEGRQLSNLFALKKAGVYGGCRMPPRPSTMPPDLKKGSPPRSSPPTLLKAAAANSARAREPAAAAPSLSEDPWEGIEADVDEAEAACQRPKRLADLDDARAAQLDADEAPSSPALSAKPSTSPKRPRPARRAAEPVPLLAGVAPVLQSGLRALDGGISALRQIAEAELPPALAAKTIGRVLAYDRSERDKGRGPINAGAFTRRCALPDALDELAASHENAESAQHDQAPDKMPDVPQPAGASTLDALRAEYRQLLAERERMPLLDRGLDALNERIFRLGRRIARLDGNT